MTEKVEWKSPRKVEEEIKAYRAGRFEYYMKLADDGILSEAEAIQACKDELENPDAIWTPDGCGA